MAARFSVGTVVDDREFDAYGAVVKQVYNATDDVRRGEWLASVGRGNVRVVRHRSLAGLRACMEGGA